MKQTFVSMVFSFVLCVCVVDRCLSFFFWPLCCLFFYDIRILVTPLVSSNSSVYSTEYVIGDRKHFEVMISTEPLGRFGSVTSA
jgi:hypothetical protein